MATSVRLLRSDLSLNPLSQVLERLRPKTAVDEHAIAKKQHCWHLVARLSKLKPAGADWNANRSHVNSRSWRWTSLSMLVGSAAAATLKMGSRRAKWA